ncbi:hypothetical protein P879_08024 [Paragonimus westermani]|uniref:Ubiquitin-like protease family profile domain-containing protein n=1 Tax=Paragonimus westermani TaxID=34504 RepID=A0A8T0CYR8_9TREM|nr:hypothetical protein P879_08024 [Paragonimus westermani]
MLQEVTDALSKKAEIQKLTTGVSVYKCPRTACNGFAFPPLMQCTLCQQVVRMDGYGISPATCKTVNGSPPLKQARISSRRIAVPILILSVGKPGIFDARHGPCVITTSSLSCNVKVEGSWYPVDVQPSDVELLAFCEEIQVVFLRPRDGLKQNLITILKLDRTISDEPNSMKWIILVLGDRMANSPENNVSIQQMELFASSVRDCDGYCKMDCNVLDTRKLLLECGLRLPRAESRLAASGEATLASIPRLSQADSQLGPSFPVATAISVHPTFRSTIPESKAVLSSASEIKSDGGLLTTVMSSLSSAGMNLFERSLTKTSQDVCHTTTQKLEDENDDLIILSEENADCDRPCSQIAVASTKTPASADTTTTTANSSVSESFKFDYQPAGSTDSVTLTQADLDCLAPGGLLNDAIINFYLKYLYFEQLSEVQRRATYLFNCFFYSRLAGVSGTSATTSVRPLNASMSASSTNAGQRAAVPESSLTRHANVAKWTRRVDLFCKDYIIIPINEASHWFLGLVCYPWMAGMVSYTALYQAAAFDLCQLTEKFLDVDLMQFSDQADDKSISEEPIERRPVDAKGEAFDRWRRRRLAWLRKRGINAMPCILLFDSLPCQTRVSNLHVIRDYLQVEWDSRRSSEDGSLYFNKDTIRGFSPRVPSQSNLVDCGIYLLHYVEMFFKQPVQSYTKDYFQNEMASWFSEDTVGQKRSEIHTLLLRLHSQYQTHPQLQS